MNELIQRIAESHDYPAELVERSAAARAAADGTSVEAVLAAWSGGEAPPPAGGGATDAAPAAPAAAAAPAPEPAEQTGPKVEVLAPEPAPEPAPEVDEAPAGAPAADDDREPAVAGGGFPRWLAVAFLVIPSIALLYALVAPAGPNCGSSGALAIDPSTGVAENCDGSEYGSDANDAFAVGEAVYEARCAACHGSGGGGGAGPAFTGGALLATFSSCAEQIEWVRLGSNGWPEPTYGDNDTPVLAFGLMPAFGDSLTDDELAAVSLYERVALSGEDREAADAACVVGDVAAAP